MQRKYSLIALFLALMLVTTIMADVPNTITYQGRLTNSLGQPETGSFPLTFSIYDAATGGTQLWTSGPQTVLVLNGLFTYELGSNSVLPPGVMSDTARWLGVKVGSDAEMTPRRKFTSEAFAMAAQTADSLTGDHYVLNTGDSIENHLWLTHPDHPVTDNRIRLSAEYNLGALSLYDATGVRTTHVSSGGASGAWLRLDSDDGLNRVLLDAWPDGTSIYLCDPDGEETLGFDTRISGTGAVTLPEGSIHSDDIANEPGIVSDLGSAGHHLNDYTMSTILSREITIPASGYIVVNGHCYLAISSVPTGSSLFAGIQIMESPVGSTPIHPYYQQVGFSKFPDVGTIRLHVTTQRIYYKDAGTYVFNLVGNKSADIGFVVAYNRFITAMYFPTSYGGVSTFATSSEAGSFESAELQSSQGGSEPDDQLSEPMYKVDLRELELRAARAQAEAERTRRELLEAQLRERDEQAQR